MGADLSAGGSILVGSGKTGVYTVFAVDGERRFQVFPVDLAPADSNRPEAAIVFDGPNVPTSGLRGGSIAFSANGMQILGIPRVHAVRHISRSGSLAIAGADVPRPPYHR